MMTETSVEQSGISVTDRLSFKLLALFLVVFLVSFFGLWTYGVAESYMESRAAEENVVLQPKPIVIDPRIQNELSKVLAFNSEVSPADVKDPFNDRTGISGLTASSTSATVASTSGSSQTLTVGGASQSVRSSGGSVSGGGSSGGTVSSEPVLTASEATKQRYEAWLDRARYGADIELDPMVFSIEDLLPVGIVDGGNGRQEVMFFSEAANRTVSFPVGTLFYDGWLTELRAEGVVFSFNDARRTVKMRSWGRSIRTS